MQIDFDWHEDYLAYREERGLDDEDLASRAALTLRLAGLMGEYNRLTQQGEHDQAAELVQWLVLPTHFILHDPASDCRYECIQSDDFGRVRVVSAYDPEEVELEPRWMPEAPGA